jgi:Fe-S-cluster containining protein
MRKESILLTAREAIRSITIDFRQYDPQIMLFCSIIGLISDNAIHFKREAPKEGVWMNQSGRANMRWLAGRELIDFMCATVEAARWTPELLASTCSRVFRSRARPVTVPGSALKGIRIETGMEAFACRQCGHCCRKLDYHNDVTAEDTARWQSLGRRDILQWVQDNSRHGQASAYRVWVAPGTHSLADGCPFLKLDPTTNRWNCQIHQLKPQICRNYPVSRKHADMTGCRGFEKPAKGRPAN